ncbi:ImmA/IrrE family metallo-endopeptidase [Endozoicomonas sp. OPT23]|uniref:ImmA/IrrE family metallo-endopeptidase n=1 Tax=Endozoicomonas sp. OPT23 TaxID=2072845 RepID=UPI00129B5DFC|nr:ImmA/IrrE family metallo-endopeptidase [Endozoicomonas sp. OPT23]
MEYTRSREEIRDLATGLLNSAGAGGQLPVPVDKVIDHLGYSFEYFQPDTSTRSIAGAVSHNEKTVYLNSEDTARRQLFTLAHEIGHIVLHLNEGSDDQDFVDYRKPGPKTSKEKEADTFAAEILMPEQHFINAWKKWTGIPSLVAASFGVSEQSVKIRARVLGLR